ncbi:hypothetical protein [Aurantimonas sp. NFXS3]|uniref:hypothetical protein n=1 Tax=Aurantimonas sp. NFXS3 TaxID=2818434 RepID=UPI003B8B3B99
MATGVQPTGFILPTLAEILDQIEQENIAILGPGLVQTPQSPMGQLNGLRAERERVLWEVALAAYQSYDPNQSEGIPLERLAALRLITRQPGETDADLAQAITNAGVANTRDADFYRAIIGVTGVSWAKVYTNDGTVVDDNGLDAHSVAVVALGGVDEEIALVARRYIVPGITAFGNTRVETEIDGFCRTIYIERPAEIPTTLEVDIYKWADAGGCPPDPTQAIAEELVLNLTGAARPRNGVTLTRHTIAQALCTKPNVEVVAVRGAKNDGTPVSLPLAFTFNEIPLITLANVTINVLEP